MYEVDFVFPRRLGTTVRHQTTTSSPEITVKVKDIALNFIPVLAISYFFNLRNEKYPFYPPDENMIFNSEKLRL